MAIANARRGDPRQLAADIVTAHVDEHGWLDEFADAVDEHRNGAAFRRLLAVWGMNQSEAAIAFGVSRQAVSRWLATGAPIDRAVAIADLAVATDILVRHLNRQRIPAVVRRPAANLGGRSLLEVLTTSGAHGVLDASLAMFAFELAHA